MVLNGGSGTRSHEALEHDDEVTGIATLHMLVEVDGDGRIAQFEDKERLEKPIATEMRML